MKTFKTAFCSLFLTLFLVACNSGIPFSGCPDGEIEWVDVLMVNDIKYQHHFPDPSDENTATIIEQGKEIGKISYKMADHACSNHKTKNGDAAYLEKGTPIYEVKGYPSSLAVLADEKVYIAHENKKAKTAGEFMPLDGFVKNIHIESTEDGRVIHTFNHDSKDAFTKTWNNLKLESPDTLYKKNLKEGDKVFLEIELNNGVSFRQVYWKESNVFSQGIVGNEKLSVIIKNELSKIK